MLVLVGRKEEADRVDQDVIKFLATDQLPHGFIQMLEFDLAEILKAIFLEVGEDNPAAIALYRAAGFGQVGRRPGYYRRKDTGRIAALIMRCP